MSKGRRDHGRGRGGGARRSQPRSGRNAHPGRRRSRDGESGQRSRSGQRRDPDGLGGDVVEGRQAVRELLLVGRRKVRELTIAEDIEQVAIVAEILDLAEDAGVAVVRTSRNKLDAEARTEAPQGIIAKTRAIRPVDLDDLASGRQTGGPSFLLVLDGITDPGNLGAILRTAEVAGVTGVVLPRHRAVRLSPAAVKSAAGAVEHLEFALVGGIPTALSRLNDLGLWSIGLDAGAGESQSIFEMAPADGPVALVLGAEGEGLSRLVAERCDLIVGIPQVGSLDSLNVAAAAAIACFEVVRRRA